MVKDQVPRFRFQGQIADLFYQAVSPPMFVRHIRLDILRIVNQDICLPTEIDKAIEIGRLLIRRLEFIIRKVDE